MEMSAQVQTKDLSVFYGAKEAVKSVSVEFKDHTVAALIGPSGCGKSTFLRALNRMNDFIEGTRIQGKVLLQNQDIYDRHVDPVLLRRHIGMVFQKPNPFPKSIRENIAWGLRKARVPKSEIPKTLEDSLKKAALWDEVKDRLDQSAFGLSGGQQQRLCIARAIALKPIVLLMDEPCSALDPIATAKIEDLIRELKRQYTIVIVTHNMQQAARISDQTAFFLQGDLIEVGDTSQVFESPQKTQTQNYLTGKFG